MHKDLLDLLRRLQALKEPDRRIDIEIAMMSGYRREVDKGEGRVLWFSPSGKDPVRIPPYTSSIDQARQFAEYTSPDHIGGCTWGAGAANASINNGPYFEAATPAIALCIAALHAFINKNDRNTDEP